MSISYKEIDTFIEEAIGEQYGDWVREYGCLVRGEGCYLIAAVDIETVVGFAALRPSRWIAPLEQYFDGFIEVIEVAEAYRRQGIGSTLVKFLEDYARTYSYYQIRAWSSDDKVEAMNM